MVGKRREAVIRWVAWHLPRELVMWCYFRVVGHATSGKWGNTVVLEITAMDVIRRWDESNE